MIYFSYNNYASMKYKGAFNLEDNIKEKCFVITPIGNESDPIRRHIDGIIEAVIEPALSDKYEVVVSHKINELGTITRQIIKEIYEDKLVIVNLTDRNPNVMYELAFRHSLGKPVILIAEKGTGLPSDIISERTIFYENDAKGTLELKDKIRNAEREIDFEKTSSPIYDMLKEISQEISILKNEEILSENSTEDKNMLGYILDRLGKIENMITKNDTPPSRRTLIRRTIVYRFRVEKDDDELKEVEGKFRKLIMWDRVTYHKYNFEFIDIVLSDNEIKFIFNGPAAENTIHELGDKLQRILFDFFGQEVKLLNIDKY